MTKHYDPTNKSKNFNIRLANSPQLRLKAFQLAHHVYSDCDFTDPGDCRGALFTPRDALNDTVVFLLEDSLGAPVGTLSLIQDSELGLPCTDLFATELQQLRQPHRKISEFTRLAILPRYRNRFMPLVMLCQAACSYGRLGLQNTDFVIEVNPHHVGYYQNRFLFQTISSPRTCHRVNGAPAVLMLLLSELVEDEVLRVGGSRGKKRTERGKTFFSYWDSEEQQVKKVSQWKSQYHPMGTREVEELGIDQACSGICSQCHKRVEVHAGEMQ